MDRKLVEEIQLLHAIADNASSTKKHDSGTCVYWLVISELRSFMECHGNMSTEAEEALSLMKDAIKCITAAFTQAYADNVC